MDFMDGLQNLESLWANRNLQPGELVQSPSGTRVSLLREDLYVTQETVWFGQRLCALLTDYVRMPAVDGSAVMNDMLIVSLQMETTRTARTASWRSHNAPVCVISYVPRRMAIASTVPAMGRWRSFAIIGLPELFESRWLLGEQLLRLLGTSMARRRTLRQRVELRVPVTREMAGVFADVMTCDYEGPLRTRFVEAKCVELVCRVIAQPVRSDARRAPSGLSDRDTQRMREVRAELLSSLAAPHTLASMARRHGINRSKLAQDFRLAYGVTFNLLLRRERMERAWARLQQGRDKVAVVAKAVGYQDPCAFSRAFRAAYGVAPIQVSRARAERP